MFFTSRGKQYYSCNIALNKRKTCKQKICKKKDIYTLETILEREMVAIL